MTDDTLPAVTETESNQLSPGQSDTPSALQVNQLLQAAVQHGVPAESMEKIIDLTIKVEVERAKKAFAQAYSKMQAELPPIIKTKKGVHDVKYAPLDEVERTVRPVLAKHGFSYSFNTIRLENGARDVVCRLRHDDGHTEETEFPMRIDEKASGMNAPQKEASASSYAKRYALLFALGTSTTDTAFDDDGNAAGAGESITEQEAADLKALAEETGTDVARFFKWVQTFAPGVEQFADIPAEFLIRVSRKLEAKRHEAKS